jgi:hypothetical protein
VNGLGFSFDIVIHYKERERGREIERERVRE